MVLCVHQGQVALIPLAHLHIRPRPLVPMTQYSGQVSVTQDQCNIVAFNFINVYMDSYMRGFRGGGHVRHNPSLLFLAKFRVS